MNINLGVKFLIAIQGNVSVWEVKRPAWERQMEHQFVSFTPNVWDLIDLPVWEVITLCVGVSGRLRGS